MRALTLPEAGGAPNSGKTRISGRGPLIDEDEASEGLPNLDLELSAPISRGGIPESYLQGRPAFGEHEELSLDAVARPFASLNVAPEGAPQWPSGITPERHKLALDPLEIRLLANYGAAPSFGPLTPLYALRVQLRKRALIKGLRGVESKLLAAEKRRDQLLADLALRLRPELERSQSFQRVLSGLSEVETLALERGSALEATTGERASELSRLDSERAKLTQELSRLELGCAQLRSEREEQEARMLRAEARYKRYFIEIRGLEQPPPEALRASGPDRLPSQVLSRIAELKLAAEASRPELESKKAAFESAREKERAELARISELDRSLTSFDRKKIRVDERFKGQLDLRSESMTEAESRLRSGLADVGRAVLAARTGIDLDADTVKTLRDADADVARLVKESELYLRALDAFDAEKVQAGHAWLGGAAAIGVAYFLYKVLL
jgi:chromosome segregation ATPase